MMDSKKAPMTASERTETDRVREFACRSCGATLVYHAGTRDLKCEYCGTEQSIDTSAVSAEEHELDELQKKPHAVGFGLETRSFKCDNCGATTACPANIVSTKCVFCGSSYVLTGDHPPDIIRPETLIPFQVDKDSAIGQFRSWIRGLWFRPNDLKRISRLSDITGVYTPFWTFDSNASSNWTADAGYYYYETETYTAHENGRSVTKTRQVQRTRWVPSSGAHTAFYDDELICASAGIYFEMMQRVYPFDLKALTPYQPELLSGWLAEEYNVEPLPAWEIASKNINNKEYRACAIQVPGDTHRNLRVNTTHDSITWKHVLLPVWLAAYQYRAKTYRFLVNGQTGLIQGDAPWSWWKIGFAVAAALALATLGYYFFQGGP